MTSGPLKWACSNIDKNDDNKHFIKREQRTSIISRIDLSKEWALLTCYVLDSL